MYRVISNRALSDGAKTWREAVPLGTFETYEEAVAFSKKFLDDLRQTADQWTDNMPMAHEYSREDAFNNGGGDLRIDPEPPGRHFNAVTYFFNRSDE